MFLFPEKMAFSVPLKTLHETINLNVTLDMKNGETISGVVQSIDDNMNLALTGVSRMGCDGKCSNEAAIFVRGSNINFIVLPPALAFAPFLSEKMNGAKKS